MRAALAMTMLLTGGLLLGGAAGAQGPTPARIGYVDLQRVLVRSQAGVAAREQLEREKAQMQREMDGRRQEIEKLRDELDKKGSLLTGDARREKEETIERKRRDAARLADDYQRDLVRKEQQVLARLQQELAGVIERLGKKKGYYLIVERRGAVVLYAAPEADLTEDVVRAYDQESGAKGKK